MYITCPKCKTAFTVDGVMIGAVGRPVHCFNCQHIWHQYPVAAPTPPPPPQFAAPPPPSPAPEPIAELEPAAELEPFFDDELPSDAELGQMLDPEKEIESVDVFAGGDDDITDIDEEALESIPDPQPLGDIHSIEDDEDDEFDEDFDPDDIPDPDPIPNVLSEAADDDEEEEEEEEEEEAPKKSLIKRLMMPLIIIVVIATLGAGLVVMRGTVVGLWSGANGAFYDWIGMHVDIPGEGLEIKTAAPARETRRGKDAVVVKGTITNISDTDRPVPVIQINAFDGNGQPVQTESMSPEKSLLKPGEKFDFSAVIIDLVPTARRLDVTFGELESEAPKEEPAKAE